MYKNIFQILDDLEGSVREATGPLSRLFRLILLENRITSTVFKSRLSEYLDSSESGITDKKKRDSERGNLVRTLADPNISVNVFMKGIRILGPQYFDMSVNLGWNSKWFTTHTIRIPISMEEMMTAMLTAQTDGTPARGAVPTTMGRNWRASHQLQHRQSKSVPVLGLSRSIGMHDTKEQADEAVEEELEKDNGKTES